MSYFHRFMNAIEITRQRIQLELQSVKKLKSKSKMPIRYETDAKTGQAYLVCKSNGVDTTMDKWKELPRVMLQLNPLQDKPDKTKNQMIYIEQKSKGIMIVDSDKLNPYSATTMHEQAWKSLKRLLHPSIHLPRATILVLSWTLWSCGLIRHFLDWEVGGLNLAIAKFILLKQDSTIRW